jgi:hypothetical protein
VHAGLRGSHAAGNNIGPSGCAALAKALPHLTALLELRLDSNGLNDDDGARIIGAAAAGGLSLLHTLGLIDNADSRNYHILVALADLHIRIPGCIGTTTGLGALASLSNLTNCRLTKDEHVVSSLVAMKMLKNQVPCVNFTNENALPFRGGCGFCDNRYPFGHPGLTDRDVHYISGLLSYNSHITSLQLVDNSIGSMVVSLVQSITHITSLALLSIRDQCMTADTAAHVVDIVFRAGMTHLAKLDLACHSIEVTSDTQPCFHCATVSDKSYMSSNSTFSASDVVQSAAWQQLQLPQPPDEIVRAGYNVILQYLFSTDKVFINELRIFVVGDSTVCFFDFQ